MKRHVTLDSSNTQLSENFIQSKGVTMLVKYLRFKTSSKANQDVAEFEK